MSPRRYLTADGRPALSMNGVAERLGLTREAIRQAVALGRLPCERVGRRLVLVPTAALRRYRRRRGARSPLGQ